MTVAPDAFHVAADIRDARTLPASFYASAAVFERLRERAFEPAWHAVQPPAAAGGGGHAAPFVLLEGFLDEPLVLCTDAGGATRCLSNVCTHRANLVVTDAGRCRHLRCGYHGRQFALDGRMRHMPGFEGARDFPAASDDLPSLPLERWGPLAFTSLGQAVPWPAWREPLSTWLSWWPAGDLVRLPEHDATYEIDAHWALYCDNYLEGFHVPYVHAGLDRVLDASGYETVLFDHGCLQIGRVRAGEPVLDLPQGAAGHGEPIGALYFWFFPNLMLNAYPWGLSVNVVEPLAPARTRIRYLGFGFPGADRDRGAGGGLDRVEAEDQAIVQAVQRGLRSRLYGRGRFSPTRERGVHHFHRMLAASLAD